MTISKSQGVNGLTPISIGDPEKVTAWPFPEPEKKTAWKDDAKQVEPAGARFLVDTELEKAKKRTEEIRALMSPPGALKLPPLLEAQRLKWGIPDGAFRAQAVFDRIHVFPIDFEGQKETYGNSSIHRPETTKMVDVQNGHRGILISMGLDAMDKCISNGMELGHIVRTIRNSPHAQECARTSYGPMYYLVQRAGDLCSSETQWDELQSGESSIVDEGGTHCYCFQINGKKKRGSHANDNW